MIQFFNTEEQLNQRRTQLQQKIATCQDNFILYGYVKELEQVEDKLQKLNSMNIVLYEDDFEKLISGDVVIKGEHRIALSDIGYHNMFVMVSQKFAEFMGQSKKQ